MTRFPLSLVILGVLLVVGVGISSAAASAPVEITILPATEESIARSSHGRPEPRAANPGGFGYRAGVPGSSAAPSTIGSLGERANEPTPELWLVPFVVDGNNPAGTTTLLSVTNEAEFGPASDVDLDFFSDQGVVFHGVSLTLSPGELQSYNLRDQPGLPGGLSRGYVEILSDGTTLPSVDFYVVTPDQDFATGDLGVALSEFCERWRARMLLGGPFTGGTSLLFLVNGPRGAGVGAIPTVLGTVYTENGAPVSSFEIRTSSWVFAVDVADLITIAARGGLPSLFGYVELRINSAFTAPDGGYVFTTLGAEGRYSVGTPGICRDSVPILF